jgi:hypothetical protein
VQRPDDALREAVSTGEAAAVEKVLASGTWDLSALDGEGHTALHRAISSGSLDVVKVLLAHGADPNVRARDGLPALLNHAVGLHRREIVDVLLDHGAKLAAAGSDNPREPFAAAWLLFSDRDRIRTVPLRPPGVVIGRDPGQCDVALADFGISRLHARIAVRPDGRMTLTDLKSKGGSQVNRVPVVEAVLAAGDRLLLGHVPFVVVSATPVLRDVSAPAAPSGMSLEEKLARIDGICARVAAAHDKGVVHGDLHDGRIRAAPDGGVEVDFSPKTVPVLSMSPEQLRGGPGDARSDVFATACIAYKILTGRPPFESDTLHAVIYRVLHEDPPDPRPLAPSLPEALAAWLRRGLAREPAERFASGGEMLEALRRVLAGAAAKRVEVSEGSVRMAWSREDARKSQDRFAYVVATGSLRDGSADGLVYIEGHVVEMTALEVHDQYGGAILAEVHEYGSAPVDPPKRGQARWISPRPRPPSDLEQARAGREHERVIGILESRLRSNPRDWNAMHELGHALIAAGRAAEGVPHILGVCDMYARDGFYKHARGLLRAAEKVDPGNPEVRSRLDAWEGK